MTHGKRWGPSLIILDEVVDFRSPDIWQSLRSLKPSKVFSIQGTISVTYSCRPGDYERIYASLDRETHGGSKEGMPATKAAVKARIAKRKADRWERKVAKWTKGFPPYEG